MQEISGEVLKKAVVIVDQIEAAMKESGEIINAVEQQKIKKEAIIELGLGYYKKYLMFKNNLRYLNRLAL